jgi:hypothetical protein
MNEYVLDFLSEDLHYMVTIFASNGTLSCLPAFINLASSFLIAPFYLSEGLFVR